MNIIIFFPQWIFCNNLGIIIPYIAIWLSCKSVSLNELVPRSLLPIESDSKILHPSLGCYSQCRCWKKRAVTDVKLIFEFLVGTSQLSCEPCTAFLIILDLECKWRPVRLRAIPKFVTFSRDIAIEYIPPQGKGVMCHP